MTGFEKGFFSVGSDGSVNCVPQLPTAQNIFKQLFQMQDKQTDRHEMAPVSGSDQSVYPDLTGSIQVDPDLSVAAQVVLDLSNSTVPLQMNPDLTVYNQVNPDQSNSTVITVSERCEQSTSGRIGLLFDTSSA